MRWTAIGFIAFSILNSQFSICVAQTTPTHDITQVDAAPLGGGAFAVPLPEKYRKRLAKYEIPELVGARQALGSQLIDGRLPNPLLDYIIRDGVLDQRISIFEGGLTVVQMTGGGTMLYKKLILPPEAVTAYLQQRNRPAIAALRAHDLPAPRGQSHAVLRIHDGPLQIDFDPMGTLPKPLQDQIVPLQDLLRAISEDRAVTNTVANYEPKVGDELVADDRKTWRVTRVVAESDIVQLQCLSQPTTIYVSKKDLHNYFIGKPRE